MAEEASRAVLECRGLAANQQVSWRRAKGGTLTDLGACDPLPAPCVSKLPALMALARPSDNVSSLTVASAERSLYGGATFTCTTFLRSAQTGSSSCGMDVVCEWWSCLSRRV